MGEGGAGRETATIEVHHRPTSIEETRVALVDGTQKISQADAAKQEAIDAVKVQVEALP